MTPEELDQLRNEYLRLTLCKDLQSCIDMLSIYSQYLLLTIRNHQPDNVKRVSEIEAKLVNQMMLTKVLYLRKTIEGVSLTGDENPALNNIIDPTVVACLIRNVFETVSMFNLVYLCPQSDEEHKIIYLLWKIAGLKYRQIFKSNISSVENEQKYKEEQALIDEMVEKIKLTNLYLNLGEKYQKMILTKVNKKDYKVRFEAGNVKFLYWHDMPSVMDVLPGLMDNMYNYFSLYAHPSNVAVFQFGEMFSKKDPAYLWITVSNLKNLFGLVSIFIADYIRVFPNVLSTFEQLPLINQLIIDSHNSLFRTRKYSINDTWKALK